MEKERLDESLRRMIDEHGGELPIGALVYSKFYCTPCVTTVLEELDEDEAEVILVKPVWAENIGDYSQHCWLYSNLVAAGKTPQWPDLFPSKGI